MQGLSDIMDEVTALNQKVDNLMISNQDVTYAITSLAAELSQLDSMVKTAIMDMGTGGEAARAGFIKAIHDATTQVGTIKTELTAAIAALTPPPVTS